MVVAEPKSFNLSRPEVLDEDIGVLQHLIEQGAPLGLLEIDGHRPFVVIQQYEIE